MNARLVHRPRCTAIRRAARDKPEIRPAIWRKRGVERASGDRPSGRLRVCHGVHARAGVESRRRLTDNPGAPRAPLTSPSLLVVRRSAPPAMTPPPQTRAVLTRSHSCWRADGCATAYEPAFRARPSGRWLSWHGLQVAGSTAGLTDKRGRREPGSRLLHRPPVGHSGVTDDRAAGFQSIPAHRRGADWRTPNAHAPLRIPLFIARRQRPAGRRRLAEGDSLTLKAPASRRARHIPVASAERPLAGHPGAPAGTSPGSRATLTIGCR